MAIEKAYICTCKRDEPPHEDRNIYTFCRDSKQAMYWRSRILAESECAYLNCGVTIPPNGSYICNNFQVEEEAPDKFLIFGEAPFEELKQFAQI